MLSLAITLASLLLIISAALAVRLKHQSQRCAKQLSQAKAKREAAEKALSEALSDSQVSLDALSDAFFLVSSDLEIRKSNTRAREIFRDQELVGRGLPEILMNPSFTDAIRGMVEAGKPAQERLTLSSSGHALGGSASEGETAWIIQVTPLPNHVNDPLSCIILRDISTEHRTEQIRTDFVANASHELRTPLAIINGYLENLLDDDIVEEPAMSRRMLTTMRKHGQRLSRLIDDMLVVSRLESGENAAINREPFDLLECANDVLERLDQIISSTGTTLVKNFPDSPVILNGDRFYWTQVMFNLIENAIKQNPNRELTVTLGIELLGADQVQITVSDNGIGIPSSHLPFIFKRFYRVDKHHTQSDIKGTGLGLSIVKRAIEAHNGTIEASSKPGIKTTFTITTPLGDENAPN
ncbi:sensor histidine kinase [Rubritalea tangerina]|uniref:histidine kinase n=1 Tax=Rubritalea tangerina TaxID=430798 RepID=A0ABW4ZAD4_9BACT